MKTKVQKMIPMVNNKGQVIHLPANTKIRDLPKFGVTKIGLMKPEDPLPDGWWRDTAKVTTPDFRPLTERDIEGHTPEQWAEIMASENLQPPSAKVSPAEESVTGDSPAGNNGGLGAA